MCKHILLRRTASMVFIYFIKRRKDTIGHIGRRRVSHLLQDVLQWFGLTQFVCSESGLFLALLCEIHTVRLHQTPLKFAHLLTISTLSTGLAMFPLPTCIETVSRQNPVLGH